MLSMEWIMFYGLLGSFVGFMSGLLGVGGGGILVPLLAMMFRYQGMEATQVVHYALGTAFGCMIFSSAASIRAHAARGNVVWKLFYGMSAGILLGTFLTVNVAAHIHSTYIAVFFACFMILTATQMFMNWKPKPSNHPAKLSGLLLAGTIIGSISALAAVGGGVLTVTYLNYKNISIKKAIGTSAAIGFPISIAGTLGYFLTGLSETSNTPYMIGFIYVPAFVIISITSVIMAPQGARYAQKLPDAYLKKIFAVVCVALSIKMIFSVL